MKRQPRSHYGSLQATMETLRRHRPMDLHLPNWRALNPNGSYDQWQQQARSCLLDGLHCVTSECPLNADVVDRIVTPRFIRERITFDTTPWSRVPGYFYHPVGSSGPSPALVVMHEWGGPMLFGADRVCGEPVHPIIQAHRDRYTSGVALADWFASQGYCVICIDAYHFGSRAPRGLHGLPTSIQPAELSDEGIGKYDAVLRDLLYLGVRQLNWAGTTWAGVNYIDDSRCIDYLLSRAEVDPARIGVTGLSGGGWRTNILAALDGRVKAAVPVGWMTTGDDLQTYNLEGAVGTFCLLPGVWNRLDVPDLLAMAAPTACMSVNGLFDPLFPPAGQHAAAQQIASAFSWSGHANRFNNFTPEADHCYNTTIQQHVLQWFSIHL